MDRTGLSFLHATLFIVFIYDQLPISHCENVALEVQRTVLRQGFHREIQTQVWVRGEAVGGVGAERCGVLLMEHLPPSLYVDPFQLHHQAQFGGPQVLTVGPVDIEAPEYLSAPLNVFVFTSLPLHTQPSPHPLTTTITLPVHVRYHQPSPDPDVTDVAVTLYHPRVLLNCTTQGSRLTEAPCDAFNTSQCAWAELSYKSDAGHVELRIPVGREEDMRVVVFGTLVITVLGATCLLYLMAFWDRYRVKVK